MTKLSGFRSAERDLISFPTLKGTNSSILAETRGMGIRSEQNYRYHVTDVLSLVEIV